MDDAVDFTVKSELAALLSSLVAIPSINPSMLPPGAPADGTGEAVIARFVCDWLTTRGVEAWIEEVEPGRANVVAQVLAHGVTAGAAAGPGDGPTLVLCAHIDTVGVTGMTRPPFDGVVEGDRLYGRGAYDMKGSVAAIMTALVRLASPDSPLRQLPQPPRGRVMAALVADEEHGSLGAFDFVKRHRADACIVTEPADDILVLAHKGFVWAEVVTTGVAAHGSRWDLGVSAIGKMAPIISALERFDRDELRARTHPLVGSASMHCALISGGLGLSTYAPECRLQIERRTLPGETAAQVEEELTRVVRAIDPTAHVAVTFSRDASVVSADAPVVRCVRDAVTHVTGETPRDGGVSFWMDAAVFSAAGVQTVNYGPLGAGAHAAVEWVDIPSVARLTDVLVESARRFFDQ